MNTSQSNLQSKPGLRRAITLLETCGMKRGRTFEVPVAVRSMRVGFTLIELTAVIAVLGFLALTLVPAASHTRISGTTIVCKNNLRQLTAAWQQWSEDHNQMLLTCQPGSPIPGAPLEDANLPNNLRVRPIWVTGALDFDAANPSNWDIQLDPANSPLWPLTDKSAALFRCPADKSSVLTGGIARPRVRSYSMSQVFSRGEWLDRDGSVPPQSWRVYWQLSHIAKPTHTFVFLDEHPDSINDGAFANMCTGVEPGDLPGLARIVDFPSARHGGGCSFSFADGHVETHRWEGSRIRNAPVTYTGTLQLYVAAGDSWMDAQWLTANTTVRK